MADNTTNQKIATHSLEGTQGVQFTQGMLDKDDSRGTITAYFSGGIDDYQTDLAGNQGLFPSNLNGVPLRYVTTKMMEGGHGVVVARYQDKDKKSSGSGRNFVPRTQFQPGQQTIQLWNSPESEDVLNTLAGEVRQRAVQATTYTILINGWEYSNYMPNEARNGFTYRGTTNANMYEIDGHLPFPPGSLFYVGTNIRHMESGVTDRWEWSHILMFRLIWTTKTGGHRYWAESILDDNGNPKMIDVYPAKHFPNFVGG